MCTQGRESETAAMSDDSSRQGYDDVLSSVRRIVASEAQSAVEAANGKLLLTPALRVESTEPDAADDSADAGGPGDAPATEAPADAAQEAEQDREFPTLAQRIAELEAAVGSGSVEFEPDGSEDQAQHAPDAVVLPLNPAARRASAGETAEADLVFAVPGEAEGANEDPEATDSADTDDDDGPANGPASSDAASLPPLGAFRHRGHSPTSPTDATPDDEEPALLDEMALRDLVAEIVREELQGGLGERITRNVRKLVRAEIQRAFAARDLD